MHACLYDVCMYIPCMPVACRGQKKGSDTLEMEFWTVVSHHKGAGKQTWSFAQTASAANHPAIPPTLGAFSLKRAFCLFCSLVAIPVYVKHSISFRDSSSLGRFEITVGPKQSMGKTIEGVTVTSQMPKGVLNMSLTPSQGTHTFDPVTKVRSWAFESPSTQAVYLVGR